MGSEGLLFYMALAFIGTPIVAATLVTCYYLFNKNAE